MSFMLCGQHIVLPIVAGQFGDPPIASQPKEQDRRKGPETPTRLHSAPEISIGSQTGIVPEDDIVEHTLETGHAGNGEDYDDLTLLLGRRTTAGGGDDDGDDSSSSSDNSTSRSSVHSQRSIRKSNKFKKIKKRIDRGKTSEQQQWKTMTGIVTPETSSQICKRMKGIRKSPQWR